MLGNLGVAVDTLYEELGLSLGLFLEDFYRRVLVPEAWKLDI